MTVELLVLLLTGFMFLAALIAVETSDLLSAVICIGAAGFALCVIDLLVGAPDLTFPQVVVEVVTLVLLIRMIMTRQDTSRQTPRDTLRTAVVLAAGGVLLVVAFFAFGGLGTKNAIPPFGQPPMVQSDASLSAQYIRGAQQQTGAGNAVMGILMEYRGYDMLGQAALIFAAILGGFVILRKVGRKRGQSEDQA